MSSAFSLFQFIAKLSFKPSRYQGICQEKGIDRCFHTTRLWVTQQDGQLLNSASLATSTESDFLQLLNKYLLNDSDVEQTTPGKPGVTLTETDQIKGRGDWTIRAGGEKEFQNYKIQLQT